MNSKIDKIRWGIIGCGAVTEVKSGPALQLAEGSELVAVMRRNSALAEDYAHRHGVPRWYDDAEALSQDSAVNAIYIATPPSSHKQYALMAARAGKTVYVEKPMALNYAECLEMIEACEAKEVPLFVAYYRRALPRFLKIKSLLEGGAIGDVRFVSMTFCRPPSENDLRGAENWRVQTDIAGAGYFFDLGSHMLDIMQFLLGEITSVAGHTGNQLGLYDAPDIVSTALTFESGTHLAGIWNFCANDHVDRTEIVGDKGRIVFSTFSNKPVLLETAAGQQEFRVDDPVHIQQPLIQTIIDELRGLGTCPSTGRSAAQTSRVMDKIVNYSGSEP